MNEKSDMNISLGLNIPWTLSYILNLKTKVFFILIIIYIHQGKKLQGSPTKKQQNQWMQEKNQDTG